jgi:hypothetical protein
MPPSSQQALLQLAFLGIALGIGLGGGVISGYIAKYFDPSTTYFLDDASWEVPSLETPYYFDVRGEINRGEIKEVMGALRAGNKKEEQPHENQGTEMRLRKMGSSVGGTSARV